MVSKMDISWDNSWDVFAEMISEKFRSGATSEEVSSELNGREVTWQGVLDRKDLDELAPSVGIALPVKELCLGEDRVATLSGIGLPVADSSVSEWGQLELGTPVVFKARMGCGNSPFLPVKMKTLRSGKTIILISFSEGVILGSA